DDKRDRWGAVHPAMMGGEYLPDRQKGEVEIARIELASTTGDVLQVRARRQGSRITYSVVDEYWDDGSRWALTPPSSKEPLTLGTLIELIDTANQANEELIDPDRAEEGLVECHWHYHYDEGEGDVDAAVNFVRVKSLVYPQLEGYYCACAEAWRQAILLE